MKRFLLLPLLLAASLSTRAQAPASPAVPAAPASTNAAVAPAAGAGKSEKDKDKAKDKLINANEREFKARDVFRFSVREDPSPSQASQEAFVTDAGEVHFLVSGQFSEYVTVDVRGKKLADIRAEVKRLLDEKYYQNSTISLDLAAVSSSSAAGPASSVAKARVFGELTGIIPIPENEDVYLSEALIGLGKNEMANLKKVKLHRKDPATGANKTFTINVDKILKENARQFDVKLIDGDRIEVPAVGIRF